MAGHEGKRMLPGRAEQQIGRQRVAAAAASSQRPIARPGGF
jgi:hypothetical protein